ncbi:MAG: hypothetical protein IKY83_11870 [Proteobacteria bacterium]|nr:hypothetical protein [Pseudomonadota bacterium]
MSVCWLKRLCVCAIAACLFVGCGLKSASPKNATVENVASSKKSEQPQAAKTSNTADLGTIKYKGTKNVLVDEVKVIAVITEENFAAIMAAMDDDKYDAISDYLESAIDFLDEHYIAKTEHAKDAWIAYQRLDDANDGSVRIVLGLAEDRNQAGMVTTDPRPDGLARGSFAALATVKLTSDGDLILTDKGQYKDARIGSIGPAPK